MNFNDVLSLIFFPVAIAAILFVYYLIIYLSKPVFVYITELSLNYCYIRRFMSYVQTIIVFFKKIVGGAYGVLNEIGRAHV